MKIHFHLPYETAPGQTLQIVVWLSKEGQWTSQTLDLTSTDQAQWQGVLDFYPPQNGHFMYYYQVLQDGRPVRQEWKVSPRIQPFHTAHSAYYLYDFWRDLPPQSWLYSTALAPQTTATFMPEPTSTIMVRAYIPGLQKDQKPFVCGASDLLGQWDPQKALPMHCIGINEWAAYLPADQLTLPIDYKFIVKEDSQIWWEKDGNRTLQGSLPAAGETIVYSGLYPRFDLPQVRRAGVVLPVFSIRTEKDWGVGDFGSLKTLVDWAAATGQKMIQILPVNDTSLTGTWQDSYPYNSVSVYAFHPMYVDISALPKLPAEQEKSFEERRKKLNALPQLDYEAVTQLKNERLQAAYAQNSAAVFSSAAFREFWNDNSHWLPAYAMFSTLRDQFQTPDWHTWPNYSKFSEQNLFSFYAHDSEQRKKAYFYFYVQFVLHQQLLEAHRYAREKGIGLKGDIPIGVSPHSADAWAEPKMFHLNAQAGAPPDDFSITGQNWGFPTYNWDEMALDNYTWWRRRFTHMTRYFDAYRIDHVLGFFRIWQIPMHAVQGLLGQFSPALPLSPREMAFSGFNFRPEYTQPYISQEVLEELFGDEARTVENTYLVPAENNCFQLREDYNTQRKIQHAFGEDLDARALYIRDGLYALCANVLFVQDDHSEQLYHPRISALSTSAFRALPADQQEAYKHLYNDYFYHRQDHFWKEQALQKLPALTQSTAMLCCAEDLGMIPNCVPEVMEQLQMLSLEIQRMPKRLGETFANTKNYPYLSVATPSTHDMSVLRGWWKENPEMSARFWKGILNREGDAPADLPADACEQILRLHLQSPSMLCMIGWQDMTSMDEHLRAPDPDAERINVPANPRHYWRYRMHMTVEDLMQKTAFNEKLKSMIQESGR